MGTEFKLGLLLTIVIAVTSGCAHLDSASTKTAMTMNGIKEDLILFEKLCGKFPEAPEGLLMLRNDPCAKQINSVQMDMTSRYEKPPTDMWGREIRYVRLDERNVLSSLGADGLPGGARENADINVRVK